MYITNPQIRIGKAAARTMLTYSSLSNVVIPIIMIAINARYFIKGIKTTYLLLMLIKLSFNLLI